jgi:recombination protein RecR
MSKHLPKKLQQLLAFLRKWPGVGQKTAERYLFEILKWKEDDIQNFSSLLIDLPKTIQSCPDCLALSEVVDQKVHCPFCHDLSRRDSSQLCIVADSKDCFHLEETNSFGGHYFVLGALLSPLKGVFPDNLPLEKHKLRIQNLNPEEIVFALDSTVEGDATVSYLKQFLSGYPKIAFSRIAFGIPLGSSLEYVDSGTLFRAMQSRLRLKDPR